MSDEITKQYHIEFVLGMSKSTLKRKIWNMANSPEAIQAYKLLSSRRNGLFTLSELSGLAEWITWDDASANGEPDAVTGLTLYRDRRCKRRYDRACRTIRELEKIEKATQATQAIQAMQANRIEVYMSEKRIKEFSNLDDAIIWANPRPWSHSLFFEYWNRNELVHSGILKQIITTNMEVT